MSGTGLGKGLSSLKQCGIAEQRFDLVLVLFADLFIGSLL
jgi:hypothetical protein